MFKLSARLVNTMNRISWLVILCSLQFTLSKAADSVLTFEVYEGEKAGTVVADISQTEIAKKITAFEGTLRFQFQGITQQIAFDIDNSTGIIRTLQELDRETLSLYKDTFQIQVKVSKGVITAVIPTEIKVLDVNDHSPTFKEKVENISVSESAPLGAELPISAAQDADIGNNSVQSYEIVSRNDDGIFELKVARPTSDITKVKLVVSKRLDRERNDSFYLVIEVRDGGSPPRVGRKGLNITVLDSNDHIPKFSQDLFVGEVKENSAAGTFVLNVTATDKDIGTNGEIVYSLEARPEYKDLFSLNSTTGELRTNAALDYEMAKAYQFEITARDRGPDSIPSTAVVEVKVLDENDNDPKIELTFLPDVKDKQGKIPEDVPVASGLALVVVRDQDSGSNGRVTVTLFHHKNDFDLREVFAGQYILEVKRPLSLDRHDRYRIKIEAKDQGSPFSRQASQYVTMHLADSNRHAPVFQEKLYHVDVRDDVIPGVAVSRLTATDEDDGKNSELRYSLKRVRVGGRDVKNDDMAKWFAINAKTGDIRVVPKLWCAFTPSFLLKVEARDRGRVPLHERTELNVTVLCSPHVFNFSIPENKPNNSEVGRIPLTPTVPDKPLRIRLLSAESGDFAVDDKLGIVSTTRKLDREKNDSYSLVAVISDGSVDMRVTLNIAVSDVNDNAPVFIGLEKDPGIVLSSAVAAGDTLFRVRATDADSGLNGAVRYSIVEGNEAQLFHINKRSGEITLIKDLTGKSYVLLIRAANSGSIEKEAFVRLTITVKVITPVPPVTRFPGEGTLRPATSQSNVAVIGNRKSDQGFFADKNMIIVVAACAGLAVLFICVLAIFCVKCKRRDDVEKRGSYHEPEISREDALKASKKMYNNATVNHQPSNEVFNFARNKPINVSPLPIKKVHPIMDGQSPMPVSPTGRPLPADVYYPNGQTVVECHSSEDELDSGKGGSSLGLSPYCPHSPSTTSKKKEGECSPPPDVRFPAPQRYRSPMMPPPPPSYDDVQRRRAFVTISGVTHSTTDL